MKSFVNFIFVATLLVIFALAASVNAIPFNSWQQVGPAGALDVQSSTMAVGGATNDVVKIGTTTLIATVNGGVWKTRDPVGTVKPHWENVFDASNVTSQSCTRFHVSLFNPARVYVGFGASTSSQVGYSWNVRNTGQFAGFAVSEDAGTTWKMASFPTTNGGYSVRDIAELFNGDVVVSVRGSFDDAADGGIWLSSNIYDVSSWKKVLSVPTFSLRFDNTTQKIYSASAAVDKSQGAYVSSDYGLTWQTIASGLAYPGGQQASYSHLTLLPGKALFLLAYLKPPGWENWGISGGFGMVFYLNISQANNPSWQIVGGSPMYASASTPNQDGSYNCANTENDRCANSLDGDYSDKDRGAILVVPGKGKEDYLFVAGNGDFLTYRVDWKRALGVPPCTWNVTSGKCFNPAVDVSIWQPMWNQPPFSSGETVDNAQPHVDSRSWAYDPGTNSLFFTSDGGIFVRTFPFESGRGRWTDFIGDLSSTFEHLHTSIDFTSNKIVSSAQDNGVAIFENSVEFNRYPARSWTGGDGTWTSASPGRLYGAIQFAGELSYVPTDFNGAPGNSAVNIPLWSRGLPFFGNAAPRVGAGILPFFQTVYHINPYNNDYLYMWANISVYNDPNQNNPGVFKLNVKNAATGPNATSVLSTFGENVLDFVVGGVVDGVATEDVVVAVSYKTLFTRYNGVQNKVALPVQFAEPLVQGNQVYCDFVSASLVPCTTTGLQTWPNHGKTMSIAVHPKNAKQIAITGWPDIRTNSGVEVIIMTKDGGLTWSTDLMGDLKNATQTISKVRPNGLAFVGDSFLVSGSINGNFVVDLSQQSPSSPYKWVRLGSFVEFPRVIVSTNNYYPQQDFLLVATMGRGTYALPQASVAIHNALYGAPKGLTPAEKALAIAFGVSIPCVIIFIGLFIWKKKTSGGTGIKGGRENEYRAVGERPSNELEQA